MIPRYAFWVDVDDTRRALREAYAEGILKVVGEENAIAFSISIEDERLEIAEQLWAILEGLA